MKKYSVAALTILLAFSACKEKKKEQTQSIAPQTEQVAPDSLQTAVVQPVATTVTPSQEDKYFLIAGSFLNKEYADAFQAQLAQKGYNAQVVQRTWGTNSEYFRVACKSFYDKSDAYNALNEMQQSEEIANVWLLIK